MKFTSTRIGIAGAVLLLGQGLSASAQQGKNVNYWPFKKGNTWTLTTHVGARTIDQIVTVIDVTSSGGATTATLEYKANGQAVQGEKYLVNAAGVARAASGPNASNPLSPPLLVIKSGLKSGDSWKWKGNITQGGRTMSGTGDLAASGPETVKTPAGTFQAMKVHLVVTISAQGQQFTIPNDYWFASNVGLVKQSAKLGGTMITGELKSYKLVK